MKLQNKKAVKIMELNEIVKKYQYQGFEYCENLRKQMENELSSQEYKAIMNEIDHKLDNALDESIITSQRLYDDTVVYIQSLVSADAEQSFDDGKPYWKLIEYWIDKMKEFENNYMDQEYYFYMSSSVDDSAMDLDDILSLDY